MSFDALVGQTVDTLLEAHAAADLDSRPVSLADIDQSSARHFGEHLGEELHGWFVAAGTLIAAGEDYRTVLSETAGQLLLSVNAQIMASLLTVDYLTTALADATGTDPAGVLRQLVDDFRAGGARVAG